MCCIARNWNLGPFNFVLYDVGVKVRIALGRNVDTCIISACVKGVIQGGGLGATRARE